jgi:hypothetical protein
MSEHSPLEKSEKITSIHTQSLSKRSAVREILSFKKSLGLGKLGFQH